MCASLRVAASQPSPSCRPSPVRAQAPTARDALFLRSYRPRRCPTSEGLIAPFCAKKKGAEMRGVLSASVCFGQEAFSGYQLTISCLLASTRRTLLSMSGSLTMAWNSSLATPIRSLSVESTTYICDTYKSIQLDASTRMV